MKEYTVKQGSTNLKIAANKLRSAAEKRLQLFCSQAVRESGMATKTFSFEFDFAEMRSGGRKKSIQKIKDIIFKAAKKEVPYLEYTKGGDFLTQVIRGDSIKVNLVSPLITTKVTRNLEDASDSSVSKLESLKWMRALRRYLRNLNRTCIKLGIPIYCEVADFNITPDSEFEKFQGWWCKAKVGEQTEVSIRFEGTISVNLRSYILRAYVAAVEHPMFVAKGMDTYVKYEEAIKNNSTALAEYNNPNSWGTSRLNSDRYAGAEKYYGGQKIFLFLQELKQCVKTLARMTSYDTSAFTIGSETSS